MGTLYLVWKSDLEGSYLLGIFEDYKKAVQYCDEYDENDEYGWYSYRVTYEQVRG